MMKSFNSHYYWLLVVLIFFFKDLEGFYIKHSSSGFCLRPLDPLRDSRVWGDFYPVGLTSDCLHSAAQFSYLDNGVLFNIFRDGCVVDVPGRTRVFEVWDGRPDNIGACLEGFAVRQNSSGSLVFERTRECAVPKEPGGTARTNKSYVGDHIQLVNYCDRNVQQFLFGSVTCERRVTTNVTCGPSQVMVIKNAVYGRYGNMKTCDYKGDTTCTLSATCIVKRLCDGRQNCTIAVKTTMFKQDPCPGVQKYLYLEYNCVDRVASAKQFVAPSGPPRNVKVMARNSSSLIVSWKEPDEDKKNGIITNYTVCISRFEAGECIEEYITGGKSLIIANLNYSTKYFVRVRASTKAGSGHFSGSQHQFTNGKPPYRPLCGTPNTLSTMLVIPKGPFSYFQVIVLKLLDRNTPVRSPNSYLASELLNYVDVSKNSSQPEPYIAAVFKISTKLETEEFELGDGRNFSISAKRLRRSGRNEYYNGPLEANTSYSIFQRVYNDQGDYYSTDWSPAARTSPNQVVKPESLKYPQDSSKTSLYVAVVILLVIIAVLVAVIVYLSRYHPKFQNSSKDDVTSDVHNRTYKNVYDEVQTSPSPADLNLGNDTFCTYEDMHHPG